VLVSFIVPVREELDESFHIILYNIGNFLCWYFGVVGLTFVYPLYKFLVSEALVHICVHEWLIERDELRIFTNCSIVSVLELLPHSFNPLFEKFSCFGTQA
jgi:hypothetical protein